MTNRFPLGSDVVCSATFTDADGAILDPDLVCFAYAAPGAPSRVLTYGVDSQLARTGPGQYRVTLDVAKVGTWRFRFWSSGNGKAAIDGSFAVFSAF